MFRPMRRNKQQLLVEESIQILKEEKRGFLAVHGDDGYPYVIPMNYNYEDNKIFFHSAQEGHKIDAIRKDNKVSFSVINKGEQVENDWYYIVKSVIVFGKISFVEDYDEKMRILTKLGDKYFPSEDYTVKEIEMAFERTQVSKLEIEHISGKVVTEK